MAIQNETLKAMIRDYHGFELSDEELDLVRPVVENYLAESEKLRDLNMSDVLPSRILRADEGGQT